MKGWHREPARHSLAAKGVKTTSNIKHGLGNTALTKASTSMKVAQKRADQLNEYMKDSKKWFGNTPNPWEDVIHTWTDYDEVETHRHDKHYQSDVVFFKNSDFLVVYNYAINEWVAEHKQLFNFITKR